MHSGAQHIVNYATDIPNEIYPTRWFLMPPLHDFAIHGW